MSNYKLSLLVLFTVFCAVGFSSCAKQSYTDTNGVTERIENTEAAEETKLAGSINENNLNSETRTSAPPRNPALKVNKQPLTAKSFAASDKYVKPLGRNMFKNNVRMFTYTCSGIEFEFNGTSADIDVVCGGKARIAVYADDKIVTDTVLEKGKSNLEVFSSDTPRKCKITLRKLSETGVNYIGVKSINVVSRGNIKPTAEKERRIEFIGDSITCGYGIDMDNEYSGFKNASQNGSKTYAALLSERFEADYSICAWGGIGVYSSYTEGSKPNRGVLIKDVYGGQGMFGEDWDFSAQQPDLVVINAGSNDCIWAKGKDNRKDKFGKAYYELIEQVRKSNPDAYIICTFGVLCTGLMDEIEKQARQFSKDTGDEKIFCFEFELQNVKRDGYGTAYHPSAKTHERMADALSEFISDVIGWE